jgi:hypothetical protein
VLVEQRMRSGSAALRQVPSGVFLVLLLYLFFLPLFSIQIPSIIAGFSINTARFLSVVLAGLVLVNFAFDRNIFPPGKPRANRSFAILVVYVILSLLGYYIALTFGEVVLFGGKDFFFRSWRGRPIAQALAFLTYSLIPYFLIRRFGHVPELRRRIIGALAAAAVFMVVYGLFQQVCFYLGLPISGRLLYEGAGAGQRVPAFTALGVNMLRFYSLGGEPRDYGTFILGAVFLFAAVHAPNFRLRHAIMAGLMALSLVWSASTNAFFAATIAFAVIALDAARQKRLTRRMVFNGSLILAAALFVFGTKFGDVAFDRTRIYLDLITEFLRDPDGEIPKALLGQSPDLAALFYVFNLPDASWHSLLFGYGWGNYGTAMAETLTRVFDYNIVSEGSFEDTRSFLLKLLIETGLVGLTLMFLAVRTTLRLNAEDLTRASDSGEARRLLMLRYSYLAFLVAALVQTSFYHFIMMGVLVGYGAEPARAAVPAPAH